MVGDAQFKPHILAPVRDLNNAPWFMAHGILKAEAGREEEISWPGLQRVLYGQALSFIKAHLHENLLARGPRRRNLISSKGTLPVTQGPSTRPYLSVHHTVTKFSHTNLREQTTSKSQY